MESWKNAMPCLHYLICALHKSDPSIAIQGHEQMESQEFCDCKAFRLEFNWGTDSICAETSLAF